MSKRKKRPKPLTMNTNCFNCEHCQYIGEGDHICDMTSDIVIEDWVPNEEFYQCNGKDFKNI